MKHVFYLMSSMKINNPKNVLVLNMGKSIKIINIIKSLINLKKKLTQITNMKLKL